VLRNDRQWLRNDRQWLRNDSQVAGVGADEMKTVETEIKYAGYLEQQKKSMARLKRDEQR